MFNPFDLPGPSFLLFYACLGVFVAIALRSFRRRNEEGSAPRIDTSDPYLIAYLRGGKNEAARVAAVSLVDRGLLKEEGTGRLWTVRGQRHGSPADRESRASRIRAAGSRDGDVPVGRYGVRVP
jgi:uncharacterized protein (TIGR04222 family)